LQLPEALIADIKEVKGFDEAAFLAAHETSAITSVRRHPLKEGVTINGEKVPWSSTGIYLAERPVFTLDPAFHAGAYYVQEASSMFLEQAWRHAVPTDKPVRILDLCAAPGGKTTLLASLLQPESLLISNEVIRSRASILHENAIRWGYTNNWVTSNDPRDFTSLSGYFDAIVIDAPCSGSGLFRKDPGALKEWSEANVQLCSARQQRIIADIWPALKQAGVLIYATCSFSPAEDEDILDHVREEYNAETIRIPLEESWGIVETISDKGMYGYRFSPDKVKGEGFFIAAIRKTDSTQVLKPAKGRIQNLNKIKDQASHLLSRQDIQLIMPVKDQYHAIGSAHEADYMLLSQALYFRKAGLELGQPTPKEWLPAHDVALSVDAAQDLPCIDVSREAALKFLKREDMDTEQMPRGWNIVKFNNLGLGWIKVLQNRANNHLPKHWRIRMDINNIEEL
jgi:16S rRNA C967 or C1407 C5-methylase (RsmB/RsmF family)/NOL1/NOP2/fmu family ribosome biogenesis protein